MKALAIAGIIFAIIQFVIFLGPPDLPSHTGYKGIGKALETLCHTQFIAAKIVNVVFVVINVKIINGASEGIVFRKKEAEELEKEHSFDGSAQF